MLPQQAKNRFVSSGTKNRYLRGRLNEHAAAVRSLLMWEEATRSFAIHPKSPRWWEWMTVACRFSSRTHCCIRDPEEGLPPFKAKDLNQIRKSLDSAHRSHFLGIVPPLGENALDESETVSSCCLPDLAAPFIPEPQKRRRWWHSFPSKEKRPLLSVTVITN